MTGKLYYICVSQKLRRLIICIADIPPQTPEIVTIIVAAKAFPPIARDCRKAMIDPADREGPILAANQPPAVGPKKLNPTPHKISGIEIKTISAPIPNTSP